MDKITVFVNRLKKINIDIELAGNYPWVYITHINNKRVTEKFRGNHGFTLAFEHPVVEFTDLSDIFQLIRKYK